MIYTYNNLSQMTQGRLVYFRSTDVEQHNLHRLLWSVTNEMLYILSQGNTILIKDKSIHKRGKIERIFVPTLNDLLNFIYFGKSPKNKNLLPHFQGALKALVDDHNLYKKYTFWRRKVKEIKIIGKTIKVKKELNPLG